VTFNVNPGHLEWRYIPTDHARLPIGLPLQLRLCLVALQKYYYSPINYKLKMTTDDLEQSFWLNTITEVMVQYHFYRSS